MPGSGAQGGPSRRGFLSAETRTRALSAIVLVLVALYAAYAGGWVFALFWLVAGIAAACEWTSISGVRPLRPIQIALGLGLALLTFAHLAGAPAWAYLLPALGAGCAAVLLGVSNHDRLWALGGLAAAVPIVLVPPMVRDNPALGIVALLWMFAVVWGSDIAAYFTGRALGGPKLWPRVSPKKTWSGFLGGLCAGVLAGTLVVLVGGETGWASPVGLAAIVLLSAVASVLGQLGDLAESAMKRHFGVKDSSRLIPGHGGVMDRIDAFWAVCLLTGLLLPAVRS